MILQALVKYFDALAQKGEIVREGWSLAKVDYALVINAEGELIDLLHLREEQQMGKKTVEVSRPMQVPKPPIRTAGIKAFFLCDKPSYLLGVDEEKNSARALRCFAASRELHTALLKDVDSPAAKAVCAYFEHWESGRAKEHPVLAAEWQEILVSRNLVFRFQGDFVQEDETIVKIWDDQTPTEEAAVMGQCLVTGEISPVAQLHGLIKGVQGAQSSGASLVSYNAPAFTSYEKEQSYNAPVSERAVFAYTTALNHLLADKSSMRRIGDASAVYWAEDAEPKYQDNFCACLEPDADFGESDLKRAMDQLAQGKDYQLDGVNLQGAMPFYILGLSPNAARLSVRFFYRNSFGAFMKNIRKHYDRLAIVRPKFDKLEYLSVEKLLDETVNKNAKDKSPSPLLAGALMNAILTDAGYPAALINGVILRIRAEHEVTRGRAAILKADLLYKIENKEIINEELEEVPTVKLNDDTTYQPYVLGRLFSVFEDLQHAVNPEINTTIRDKYFTSAATTPRTIFPILRSLSSKHLRRLKSFSNNAINEQDRDTYRNMQIKFSKQINVLHKKITELPPIRHSLAEQEAFYIGYHHQTQKRYEGKEKKETTDSSDKE